MTNPTKNTKKKYNKTKKIIFDCFDLFFY